jgi:hypothetical protein
MKLVISLCVAAGWLASIAWLAGGTAASETGLVRGGTAALALPGPIAITAVPSHPAARVVSSRASQQPAPASPTNAAGSDPDDPKLAGTFTGRILGPDAKPVAGAKIFIVPDGAKIKAIGPVRALTGADGRFSFDAPDMTFTSLDGLPARRPGLLFATHEGYAPDWMTTWGQPPDEWRIIRTPVKQAEYTLRLAKNDVTIHGALLDPDGGRLAGARVRLMALMVPTKFDLNAYLESQSDAHSVDSTNHERYLTQPKLLPGATVETFTDTAGRFAMSGLGRDRLAVLEVSAPKGIVTKLTVMTRPGREVETRLAENGKPTQTIYGAGFNLQLKPGRTLTGIVRDRDTHNGIPGMWVGPHGEATMGFSAGEYARTTDKDGRFTIAGLDPSSSRLEITAVPQPGQPYPITTVPANEKSEVVIEPQRGIPFRLQLTDEQGKPPFAEVTYQVVLPNAHMPESRITGYHGAINFAARRPDGTYESFVLPGPGAVLVRLPDTSDYRPAHVDPKAFFAPGKTQWTAQDQLSTYGNHDTLSIFPGFCLDQHEYAAIVLVNPPENSGPLELTATISRDKPRQVSLVDPDHKPVIGATSEGLTFYPSDREPRLRTASFPITKLHPDRLRRITFMQEDRKLIGFLGARGDGEAPYTVRMQHWGTLTGRIVDEDGNAVPSTNGGKMGAYLNMGNWSGIVTNSDATVGEHRGGETDEQGRFRLEKLVPGLRYSADIYRRTGMIQRFAGMAFENLVLKPGEVKELGDIRCKPPVNAQGK